MEVDQDWIDRLSVVTGKFGDQQLDGCSWTEGAYVTPSILQLHWLPFRWRVQFKICCLMHSINRGNSPEYLKNIVRSVAASRRRPCFIVLLFDYVMHLRSWCSRRTTNTLMRMIMMMMMMIIMMMMMCVSVGTLTVAFFNRSSRNLVRTFGV